MITFGDSLNEEDYAFCIELLKNFIDKPTGSNLISSYINLTSVILTYSRVQMVKLDWYDYASGDMTYNVMTGEKEPFRISRLSGDYLSNAKKQTSLIVNLYRNCISSEDIRLSNFAGAFTSIRNSLAHDPNSTSIRSITYRLGVKKFPSLEITREITKHILDSNIGYDYMAEVIKFYKGKYPKEYVKENEKFKYDFCSNLLTLDE